MPQKTLLVCDAEPIAIEGLRSLAGSRKTLCVVDAYTSIGEAMNAIAEFRPDVAVIDKAFGMQPVIEAVREIGSGERRTRAVVWGAVLSDSEALRFLHAGAAGVVRKTAQLETLLDCFTSVASGLKWMEGALVEAVALPPQLVRQPLTARELQVVELVERGMTNREIARDLGIRTGTVKIHLKHIFEKTGVRGRYGLALSGLRNKGLAQAPVLM